MRIISHLALVATTLNGGVAVAEQSTRVYGYLNGYVEKVEDSPDLSGEKTENPHEFDVPNLNVIIQSTQDSYKSYVNLSGGGAGGVEVANAWVEAGLFGEYLSFRIGKMYRPFGLYNEILDATPTYIGIEPPELFDGDHLLLTRTTNAMLRGKAEIGPGFLHYAMTTGNDERASVQVPLGLDINYQLGTRFKIGGSYYSSSGKAAPTKKVGEGSPDGAVVNWMAEDEFSVTGGYVQYKDASWTLQVASYSASHDATRDAAAVAAVCKDYALNETQRKRFGCDDTIVTDVTYDIATSYVRAGYTIPVGSWYLTPYSQYDIYKNPESVFDKNAGGDKEAGLADDGQFVKTTLGVVIRPNFNVAIKLDYSQHDQKILGKNETYGETRAAFTYFWQL